MADVAAIIEELGDATAVARAIRVPVTTVHSWKRSGFVPEWRIEPLVKLARKQGKPIAASDFPKERPASQVAA